MTSLLGVPVRRLPIAAARALAGVAALRREPTLTRYAIDQITDGLVLDIGRAQARGWRPEHTLAVLNASRLNASGRNASGRNTSG